MRLAFVLCVILVFAGSASAQSAYVGASFIGDMVRVTGSSYGDSGGNGETFGGALRVGTPLGERWGVELEFARSGKIDMVPGVFPATRTVPAGGIPSGSSFWFSSSSLIFPTPQFESDRRLSTLSTFLWWSNDVADRVSLVYLGGVAFTRSDIHLRIGYPFPLGQPAPIDSVVFPIRDIDQKTTAYDADVAVGFEGQIGMTDHLRLVPGIRLQTAAGGWAIRPGVGVQWRF